jgi:hypothetical protein
VLARRRRRDRRRATAQIATTAYSTKNFQGLVTLDNEGYAVWYANATALRNPVEGGALFSSPHIVGFDQFADGGYCMADAGTNALVKVGPDGELEAYHNFPSHATAMLRGPFSNSTYHEVRRRERRDARASARRRPRYRAASERVTGRGLVFAAVES